MRIKAPSETIIARYQEALERDPSLARARLGLADELFQSNRYAEAASEYNAYLTGQPNDPLGYLGACQNALKMGDLPDAQTLIDRGARSGTSRCRRPRRTGDARAPEGRAREKRFISLMNQSRPTPSTIEIAISEC